MIAINLRGSLPNCFAPSAIAASALSTSTEPSHRALAAGVRAKLLTSVSHNPTDYLAGQEQASTEKAFGRSAMARRKQCFEPREELRVPAIPDTRFDHYTFRRLQINRVHPHADDDGQLRGKGNRWLFKTAHLAIDKLCGAYSCRTTFNKELWTFISPLYSTNPSCRNLFMKWLTRDRVVPIISAIVVGLSSLWPAPAYSPSRSSPSRGELLPDVFRSN